MWERIRCSPLLPSLGGVSGAQTLRLCVFNFVDLRLRDTLFNETDMTNDYIKLAWRNLWRNKRRTLITAASIFFGVL